MILKKQRVMSRKAVLKASNASTIAARPGAGRLLSMRSPKEALDAGFLVRFPVRPGITQFDHVFAAFALRSHVELPIILI